ncbi:unnamed protein product, partial [Rotaria magnacalcarata]
TMEIEIDPRIHSRIIGSGGVKLQQITKEYEVEIKFQAHNQPNKVHVIGLDQDKIDACIDHLLLLEEDFLQDLPHRAPNVKLQNESSGQQSTNTQQQQQQQETPTVSNVKVVNKNKKQYQQQQQQAPFQVKNAPWTNGKEPGNEHQSSDHSRQRNGHDNSTKISTSMAPKLDDLGKMNKIDACLFFF